MGTAPLSTGEMLGRAAAGQWMGPNPPLGNPLTPVLGFPAWANPVWGAQGAGPPAPALAPAVRGCPLHH